MANRPLGWGFSSYHPCGTAHRSRRLLAYSLEVCNATHWLTPCPPALLLLVVCCLPLRVPTPGGFGLVVGLMTYGYNIIMQLGVKMLKLTPSRGFSAELSAALTVSVASRYGLPVSTTQIIVGAESEWMGGWVGNTYLAGRLAQALSRLEALTVLVLVSA